MRTLGLLGGMSWQSSIEYERLINTAVRDRIGGAASADLIIRSYNFAVIEALQEAGKWEEMGELLATDAALLENSGAEAIVLCTNTMHRVADAIGGAITVPLIHIADETAKAVRAAGLTTVALLGTRYTMEETFYVDRLASQGLEVLVPDEPDRTTIHDIIFDELVRGEVLEPSRNAYVDAVNRLLRRGAHGVISGCTEIELLIGADDIRVPFFPTTALHAAAAVDFALLPKQP